MLEMCAVHRHKRLKTTTHFSCLSPGKQRCRMLDEPGRRPVETRKQIVSRQRAHVWQWLQSEKVAATVCPLHSDIRCDCNKSSVR